MLRAISIGRALRFAFGVPIAALVVVAAVALRQGALAVVALAAVAAAAAWWVASTATRRVTAPLDEVLHALTALTAGDLKARAEPSGPAELRELAASLNALAGQTELLHILQRERLEREKLLNRVARLVREELDPDAVLRRCVNELGPALGVDRVLVRLVEEDGIGAVRALWSAPGVPPLSDARSGPLTGDVGAAFQDLVSRHETMALDDMTGLQDHLPPEVRIDAKALLSVPLSDGADPVGVLVLHDVRGRRAWSLQVPLVEALARDVAGALAHAFAYERLRALDREKATFVSSVSHELRTPLTSIIGYVEMLADGDVGELTPEQRDLLGVVERSTGRLLTLIEDLLTLSRIEAGAFRSSFAAVDLAEVVTGAREALGPVLAGRKVTLDVDLADGLPPLWADPDHVERLVFNLVSNAAKFSPEGGTVRIETREVDGEAELAVVDHGIGIPIEEQANLFTSFFRSTTSTSLAIQGTGLGLSIVRNIVDQHGGSIAVDSAPGRGTTVRVTLPFALHAPIGVR